MIISKTITPDRSKIIIEHEDHVKYWTRHFGVTKDELTRAIERVGNSAAAVRKQLGAALGPPATEARRPRPQVKLSSGVL